MNAVERRDEIKNILLASDATVSAAKLAEKLNVSRQVIVGDIALMRAEGMEIKSTPRGYILTHKTDLSSRYDADVFMSKINEADQPLSRLSDGIHEHRIGCRDKEIFELIRKSLREKKILIE